VVALAVLAAGCSGDQGLGNNRPSGGGIKPIPIGAGGAAATTDTSGASGASFGNSMSPPTSIAHLMIDGGQLVSDGGACLVGKFCASTNPDQGCGTLTLDSTVKKTVMPGNVLIIFDRSQSMKEDWNGMPKWQAAGTAVLNALMPIADQLTIGAVLFPSPDTTSGACTDPTGITCLFGNAGNQCGVNPITAMDQVTFKAGPQAITELQTGSNGSPKYQPVGRTPTYEALQQADMALTATQLVGTVVVVLVTDGEPNCMWDQNASVMIIGNWLSQKNIKTYVVGLPGAGMGNGPAVLTALAQAGGTMTYFTPTDSMALETQLAMVVSQTISSSFDSCSLDLMPPTSSPDKLQLVVTETSMPGVEEAVAHDLGGAGGWTISGDGSHVELTGGLCDHAKSGFFATLTFKFGCKDIPPIPPSHVM
jgi:uncharacterized protein YegL